jgi:hypothetical protein
VTVVGCHVLMPNLLPIRVRGEEVSTTYSWKYSEGRSMPGRI